MKKTFFALLLGTLLMLPGCTGAPSNSPTAGQGRVIAAVTYPVYLFARGVTDGVEGMTVELVTKDSLSCLHNYTLTVDDMLVLEGADIIARSGAGLDTFLDDALRGTAKPVINCSKEIALLTSDEGEPDPHIWLDPKRAAQMTENLAAALAELDPENAEKYLENGRLISQTYVDSAAAFRERLDGLSCRELVTFHDGFAYFAEAYDLTILKSIEEEAGSEPSAKDIAATVDLIRAHRLPAIFVELGGPTSTANTIVREFDPPLPIFSLSTIMYESELASGGDDAYLTMMEYNITQILEALS